MEKHWKSARPAPAWNPFGQLPAPQRGGSEASAEESCASNTALSALISPTTPKIETIAVPC